MLKNLAVNEGFRYSFRAEFSEPAGDDYLRQITLPPPPEQVERVSQGIGQGDGQHQVVPAEQLLDVGQVVDFPLVEE